MRVLITANCRWFNASAEGAVSQAVALAARGHGVLLQAGKGSTVLSRAGELGLETVGMDLEGAGSLTGLVPFRKLVGRFSPDVICCHRAEGQTAAALTAPSRPLVRVRSDIRPPRGGWLWRRVDGATDLVVLPSGFMVTRGYAGQRRGPLTVIPQPVDTGRFPVLERDPGSRSVVSAARLSPVKGHRTLVRAIARLPREVTAVIAGPPAQDTVEGLMAFAGEQGVADRIRVTGPVEDVRVLFRGAFAGVVTSLGSEVVSRSGMEMMSSGLPLLAASTNGLTDLVRDGVTGLLHPPGNDSELARQIAFLLANPSAASRLAASAARFCRESLSLEAVGRLWEETLEAVAAGEQLAGWRVSRLNGSDHE